MRLVLEFYYWDGEQGGRVTTPVDYESREVLLKDFNQFIDERSKAEVSYWEKYRSADVFGKQMLESERDDPGFLGNSGMTIYPLRDIAPDPDTHDEAGPIVYTVDEWFEKRGARKA